ERLLASLSTTLDHMVRKFARRAPLDDLDRKALLNLPYQTKAIELGRYTTREGARPPGATLILSGLAFRHKVTIEGSRQILSVHIPGDFVDLESALLKIADHNVKPFRGGKVGVCPRK